MTTNASASNLRKNLGTVIEWFPIISLVTALGDAPRGVPRVLAAMQVLRFVAAKTTVKADDELLVKLEAICLTTEGRALIDYISDQIAALTVAANAYTVSGK